MGCASSKASAPPAPAPAAVPEETKKLLEDFMGSWFKGTSKEYVTEDMLFNPPGAPPMPMEQMAGMMEGVAKCFPDWTSRFCFVEATSDPNTFTVGTQQDIGVMKGDFPAMGPFPFVAMADVPERCKTEAITLPVEVGTYTIRDGKIASGSYKANGEFRADWKANGGLEPSAFVMEWWPQGLVGFACLFKWFDKMELMPAPPPADEKPNITAFVKVKEGVTVEEYASFFWSHADSTSLTFKDKKFELSATRSEFCDESKTAIYSNLKSPKQLAITIFGADMEKMGGVMGSAAFIEAGSLMWEMDPATDLKFMSAPPPPPTTTSEAYPVGGA